MFCDFAGLFIFRRENDWIENEKKSGRQKHLACVTKRFRLSFNLHSLRLYDCATHNFGDVKVKSVTSFFGSVICRHRIEIRWFTMNTRTHTLLVTNIYLKSTSDFVLFLIVQIRRMKIDLHDFAFFFFVFGSASVSCQRLALRWSQANILFTFGVRMFSIIYRRIKC